MELREIATFLQVAQLKSFSKAAKQLGYSQAAVTIQVKQLEKELNDLKRQNAVSDMAKTARKMLADEEINLPDEVIFNLVSEYAELTKTAVEAFAKTFKEAVQAAVKDALRGTTPKAAGKPSEITKEQILNVKDTNERRRLMAENPELFIRR